MANPVWGDSLFREVLPNLLKDWAITAAHVQGPKRIGVALMKNDTVVIVQDGREGALVEWFPDGALASVVYDGNGTLKFQRASSDLATHPVAGWLRG